MNKSVTLFSCPKPFRDRRISIIQYNAIKSWTLLRPRPEIILFGDEEGTSELAVELGTRHIPGIGRNEYGTPLLSSVFGQAQSVANHELLCYVNADIILMEDFMAAVDRVAAIMGERRFLLVGRRWNIRLDRHLDFDDPNWAWKLRKVLASYGRLDPPESIDYFLFRRGSWDDFPPLALGRGSWDNWLIYKARSTGTPVVDATCVVTAVHQEHDYTHVKGGRAGAFRGVESRRNLELAGGYFCRYTTWDATHKLTAGGLRKAHVVRHLGGHWIRLREYGAYLLKERLHPYSWPLVVVLKAVRRCCNGLGTFVLGPVRRFTARRSLADPIRMRELS